MYAFIYVDPEKTPGEDNSPATNMFVDNYKKISIAGPVPKHWIGYSFIYFENYGLYMSFNETELKMNLDHAFNNKYK